MDQLVQFLRNLSGSISQLWLKASMQQRIIAGVVVALVLSLVISLFFTKERTKSHYLYTDLDPSDMNSITKFLSKTGYTDFEVDERGIKIPDKDFSRIHILLSQEGLPQTGIVGWEQFDQQDFTRTEFEQEVQRIRAIQGELARSITSLDGVTSTRVHIVIPKNSVFIRDGKEPSASLYIKTKRGFELDKKQIRGIQHLVSHAVEGLKPSNISIISSAGHLISEQEVTNEALKQSKDSLQYQRQIEKNLEQRIHAIVGRIVGHDRVESKVDAEVDFTIEEQTIEDIDPDDTTVISKNTSGFSMEGQGLNPTGIPGSKSNVPGEQEELSVLSSKSGSKKESELINYESSKTVSHKKLGVGKVVRLTISVAIDGKQIYPVDGSVPEFEPRSAEEIQQITSLIKNSVGFKESRGDSLTVQNIMFQLDPYQALEIKKQKKEDREYLSTLAISSVIALAIVFFFAFIVRPYFRWLSYDPERKEEQSTVEEYKPDLELGSMQNVQVQEDVPFEKLSTREQVMYLAKNEPKRTTEAIRIMINPSRQG